jgi:phage terminase large subunit GpA-like protein
MRRVHREPPRPRLPPARNVARGIRRRAAWGADEECWPFLYRIINLDPAQPAAWRELDALLLERFSTVSGRSLRIAAFGIDTGGHHGAQVYSFCKRRRGRRIFPTKGIGGKRPIWAGRAKRTQQNDALWLIGVDSAKDAIYSRLKIAAPEPGKRKPGFIHFPAGENFGPEYFEQLTSERRETRKRMGQPYTVWVLPEGKRNEVLDTFVGSLAVRRALPRRIEAGLEYSLAPEVEDGDAPPPPPPPPRRSLASQLAR